MSILKFVRRKCLECMNGQSQEVKLCPSKKCFLYPFRFGRKGNSTFSPLKAIRKRCLDCGEGTYQDVKNCLFSDCPLFHYRFGKNPARRGIKYRGNPEALKKWRLRLYKSAKKGIVERVSDPICQRT